MVENRYLATAAREHMGVLVELATNPTPIELQAEAVWLFSNIVANLNETETSQLVDQDLLDRLVPMLKVTNLLLLENVVYVLANISANSVR